MADVGSGKPLRKKDIDMEGWLHKWTNYIKGYQKRWFVLSKGLLSYYRNPADMSHTCRGNISIANALIHTEDSCNFLISNGGTQTFHLRATNEVERQKWVTALELAKARLRVDSEDEEIDLTIQRDINADKQDLNLILKNLSSKLDDLKTCHDLNVKRGTALQRALNELESLENPADAVGKIKSITERATLFRITSSAMIKAGSEYLSMATVHGKRWQKLLQHEHEARLRLEEMIEQLAKQHSHLEQRAIQRANSLTSTNDDDNDEFFDAEEMAADFFVPFPGKALRVSLSSSGQFPAPPTSSSHSRGASTTDVTSSSLNPPSGQPTTSKQRRHSKKSTSSFSDDGSGQLRVIEDDVMDDESTGSDSYGSDTDSQDRRRRRHTTNLGVVTSKGSIKKNKLSKTKESSKSGSLQGSLDKVSIGGQKLEEGALVTAKSGRIRRRRIPEKPNQSLNLWSFMKNCIGKELTKIPMPVNFNEPLSMLQRVTEDFEHADLLHRAAKITDPCEQLVYVAAFCVSHYANSGIRTGKPFNPLLGETYECDRSDDLGWKSISEQVSHHPPMLAMHVEGKKWKCWSEFSISSKFRGKYLQVNPVDISHLEFESSGHHLTFRKVTTTVHNIIVGKLWIDNHGDLNIVNHSTGDQCHLKFIPYSYFSRETPRKVSFSKSIIDNCSNSICPFLFSGHWSRS